MCNNRTKVATPTATTKSSSSQSTPTPKRPGIPFSSISLSTLTLTLALTMTLIATNRNTILPAIEALSIAAPPRHSLPPLPSSSSTTSSSSSLGLERNGFQTPTAPWRRCQRQRGLGLYRRGMYRLTKSRLDSSSDNDDNPNDGEQETRNNNNNNSSISSSKNNKDVSNNSNDSGTTENQNRNLTTGRAGGRTPQSKRNLFLNNKKTTPPLLLEQKISKIIPKFPLQHLTKRLLPWLLALSLFLYLFGGLPGGGGVRYYQSTVYESTTYDRYGRVEERTRKESVRSNVPGWTGESERRMVNGVGDGFGYDERRTFLMRDFLED